jgi:hypothetical protein
MSYCCQCRAHESHCCVCALSLPCLKHDKDLSGEDIRRYIHEFLDPRTCRLDMSYRENVDSDVVKELATSKNAHSIDYLDLRSTRVGFNGIIGLWDSSTFGHISNDSVTYERHTGSPLRTINIEIADTLLYKQYKKKKFEYPLPLLRDFMFMPYGEYKVYGYKQIILLEYGKELAGCNKRSLIRDPESVGKDSTEGDKNAVRGDKDPPSNKKDGNENPMLEDKDSILENEDAV